MVVNTIHFLGSNEDCLKLTKSGWEAAHQCLGRAALLKYFNLIS